MSSFKVWCICTCFLTLITSRVFTWRCKPSVQQRSQLETCAEHKTSETHGDIWTKPKWDKLVFHFHVLQLWKEPEGLDFKGLEERGATTPGRGRTIGNIMYCTITIVTHTHTEHSQTVQSEEMKMCSVTSCFSFCFSGQTAISHCFQAKLKLI